MHANAPEPAPPPLVATVQMVVVVVAAVQVPVSSNSHPFRTCPTPQDAQAVLVPTNATVLAPEPSRALVVPVATPQMPIRAHVAPMPLVVSIQGAQTIEVDSNASVSSPSPRSTAVHAVVIVIASPQMPISSHLVPSRSSPPLQDAQAIEVTSNAPPSAPEPTRPLVIMVSAVQMPI